MNEIEITKEEYSELCEYRMAKKTINSLFLTHIQGTIYDPYNHGLANGLILALKTLGCDDIEFLTADDYEHT